MNAYYYNSNVPIKSLMGFEIMEEGIETDTTTEGANEIDCTTFPQYVERFAVKGDILIIIHNGTYTQFLCEE